MFHSNINLHLRNSSEDLTSASLLWEAWKQKLRPSGAYETVSGLSLNLLSLKLSQVENCLQSFNYDKFYDLCSEEIRTLP